MVLTDRQRTELHSGIYEYLLSQNGAAYRRAAEALAQADPNIKSVSSPTRRMSEPPPTETPSKVPILEKKWTAVTKLQQKVLEMEKRLESRQDNTRSAAALPTLVQESSPAPRRLLPRSPCTHSLQGHSAVVTCLVLHPIFTLVVSGGEDSAIKVLHV